MLRRALLAGLGALPLARPALAQGFPDRPLTMILAFPAGGGTDVAARPLARIMERYLGQHIAVVNRPGAAAGSTQMAPGSSTMLSTGAKSSSRKRACGRSIGMVTMV